MDWIKYPYRAKCRFNSNDDTVSIIQWTVARPDAPLLGIGSRVCNLCLELDKESYDDPVGEIWEGGRRAYWARTPAGIDGQHRCGTDDDFRYGGTQDTTPPLPQYGAFGWPLCCDPPRKVYGGAGAGGSPLLYVLPPIRGYGYAGAGGRAVVAQVATYPPTGGLGLRSFVVPLVRATYPPTGGLGLRSFVVPLVRATYPPTGGLGLRSFVVPRVTYTFPPTGGMGLSPDVSPFMIGSISTSNQTGGPIPLTNAITLVGAGATVLTVSGNTITITTNTGPAPPNATTLTGYAPDSKAVLNWTAVALADSYLVTQGSSSLGFTASLTYTVTGLTNNTAYTFSVYPYHNGAAGPGASVTLTPTAAVLFDSFTLNPGTLNGRAVEGGSGTPQTWAVTGTALTVSSGLTVTGTGGESVGLLNGENANQTVSVTITAPASGGWAGGVVARAQSATNYFLAQYNSVLANLYLYEFTSDTPTVRVTVPYVWAAGATHTVALKANGTTFTLYFDGVSQGTYTSTDYSTQTGAGVRLFRDGTTYTASGTFQNFTVSNP